MTANHNMLLNIQITSSLIKSQPTYVVVGDINTLPYKDEIGL